MTADPARAGAFAALAILVAGYAFVFRPLDAAAADRYASLDAENATLARSIATARRVPALEAERRRYEVQLARVRVSDGRAATIDRFLRGVAAVGGRDGITVESVTASVAQAPAGTSRGAAPSTIDEVPLDLTIRGRYGDVIRAVRDLNGGDVATRISLASLGNAERRPATSPQLSAAFHVFLLREADEPIRLR